MDAYKVEEVRFVKSFSVNRAVPLAINTITLKVVITNNMSNKKQPNKIQNMDI